MNIRLQHGLPFVNLSVAYRERSMDLLHVLLDTGSAGTVLSTDRLLEIGVRMEPQDTVHRVYAVGGREFVFSKRVDNLAAGDLSVRDFEIEIGALAYGFELDGIAGLDFLRAVRAIIDLGRLELYSARHPSN